MITGVSASATTSSATVSWVTDEPADSRVDYGPTSSYGQTQSAATLVTSHQLTVSGLACASVYHFRVSSGDAAGNRATGTDASVTTQACASPPPPPPPPPPGPVRADEFDGTALDTSVWRVLDPLGNSSVSVASGRLRVALPAGAPHDLWEGALHAPRVLQSAVDADFEIEAKFDSAVIEPYQANGLVAHADADDLVRFDVYAAGGETRVFAATFANGQATVRASATIPGGAPVFLRMARDGSAWTLRYSSTGSSWTTATSFSFPLALREFGVFAANAVTGVAYTAQVDYFRVLSEGAPPPPPPPDTVAPVISGVAATPGTTTATVSWTTDEEATSTVEFGPTAAYGETRTRLDRVTGHSITFGVLQCDTTYHYRVSSADAAGNRATSPDGTFATRSCASSAGPQIDIWYGDSQTFGRLGFAQRWLNVLGKASDPDGLLRIDYSVDGGPRIALVFDPKVNLRIGEYGDFNIELDRLGLTPGRHLVTIVAADELGNESTRTVDVDVRQEATWPLPYDARWSAGLTETAQPVDGLWRVEGEGLRTVEPGYDRTIALGDESWDGIDATIPLTVHSFRANSDHAGVGAAAGWRGHEGVAWMSPRGEWPLGGLCFYYRHVPNDPFFFWLMQYGNPVFVAGDQRPNWLEVGAPYLLRVRSEPVDAQQSRYSCKLWRAADPEPETWTSALLQRRSGSILLVADHADVTFGRFTVRALGSPVPAAVP